jgi:single-strand DNA-binding protein
MYLNRLTLIGFIGGDAETKTISNGSTFTTFSVAPLRFIRQVTDFAATLKKGAHVQVEGELRAREYEKDGVKHKIFECRLESILRLDRAERRASDEADDSQT